MTATSATPETVAGTSGPGLRTRIAAVVVSLALAGLAAYAMFSGPTIVPVPAAGGPAKSTPKTAPQNEDQFPENGKEGGGG
ncbi:MAG: hypothetical protein ACRDPE_01590 [Solirubrobacterales bacterium]